ncbi:ATP-binding cassette domain-containing protein [bacterium]|jgi:ABC-type Mn2+/Zn2+ transport system ATPase subunit|nr:ATP-binding cassette domain-containing protein [bacterium]NBW56587.1 ATP-binding cassette domain-containing protein [bacterium]NBX71580.1 ATP-binding cassette domain-containing protein [bacterium]
MPNILNVQALNIGYAKKILLKNLNFSVETGEILVVLGANGIGKSTLVKTLLGLVPALSGIIEVYKPSSYGFMPQMRPDQPHLPMTVADFMDIFSWDPLWKKEVIKQLELGFFWNKQLQHLSFGMWQRVNLAQAVSSQPKLIFLDEPTQGLDIHWQTRTYEFLAKYAVQFQAGICCVSHDTVAVTNYADKVLCLDHQPAHQVSLTKRISEVGKQFIIYQHDHS